MQDKRSGPPTPDDARSTNVDALHGTTLRVYRFLYRTGKPAGIHEIQRALGLKSASIAHYHVTKLVENGLAHQREDGYTVNKIMFENIIRIRRSLIPLHAIFAIFFASTFVSMVTIVRPPDLSSGYLFGVVVNISALAIFVYLTFTSLRKTR